MNDVDIKVGKLIRERRKEMRLSQEELADKVHCTKICVHYYETGKRGMSLAQFFEFCDVLKLNPNQVQKELERK